LYFFIQKNYAKTFTNLENLILLSKIKKVLYREGTKLLDLYLSAFYDEQTEEIQIKAWFLQKIIDYG